LQDDTDRFLAAGITDILIKPLSGAALRKALVVRTPPHPDADEPSAPTVTHVHAELSSQLGAAQTETLYATFVAEADALVALTTQTGWAGEPFVTRADAVHKLAGSAAVLGATRLRACLQQVEIAFRQGQDGLAGARAKDLHAIWDETRAEIAACLPALKLSRHDPAKMH